jgi:hypothetical protein
MTETVSPGKSAMNFGVTFGIIMILQFVIMYVLDINPQESPAIGIIINVLNYLILPFTLIYLAANNYKTKINHGFISLGETIKVGLTVCAIASLMYGVFYLIFDFIFPEFKEELLIKIQEITVKQNPTLTSEQLKMSMKFVKTFMNPYIVVPFTIVMYCVIGLIHSLIVGVIVKKDKPVF